MTKKLTAFSILIRIGISVLMAHLFTASLAADTPQQNNKNQSLSTAFLPTNQLITPTAAVGSELTDVFAGAGPTERPIGQITRAALSPDGQLMVALSSGFNRFFGASGQVDINRSNEALLVYSLSAGLPKLIQSIDIANTFMGITFNDDGSLLFVSGGKDDLVYRFKRVAQQFVIDGEPLALHSGTSLSLDLGLHTENTGTLAAGVASIHHGRQILVNLYEHDAIARMDTNTGELIQRLDLRPGKNNPVDRGKPGGEYPLDVVSLDDDNAVVASMRDRELVVLNLSPSMSIKKRISLPGQPLRLITDKTREHLFVSTDNADEILVYDSQTLKLLMKSSARVERFLGTGQSKPGAIPNNLSLSADQKTLFVTNAGDNAVVAFHIDWRERELEPLGAIPTGWYPSAVIADPSNNHLYVFNAKSPSGANPDNCKAVLGGIARASGCDIQTPSRAKNQYGLQLIHSSLLTIPLPNASAWSSLTEQVARNNGYRQSLTRADSAKVAFLQKHIHHVIYVVRENRTFDQILGDLPNVAGDPTRAQFPQLVTPNAHNLARQFSVLDHYFCSGDVSMNGWQWSTSGRVSDINEKTTFINYAKRGGSYDSEGGSRGINMAIGGVTERIRANPIMANNALSDPDLLPGPSNVAEVDSPQGQPGAGYIWSSALRAKKSVRNYGFFIDLTRYDSALAASHPEAAIGPLRFPRASHVMVSYPAHEELIGRTDPYFLGFDTRVPDFYRVQEWMTEFAEFSKEGNLPALSLVRLMMDHTGSFKETLDAVNTPELQIADNDYALGLLIDKVAHSRYAKDTLIVVTEDDAQDGPDHIDSHRSPAFLIGPYTQLGGQVISQSYTTVNLIKTIETVLGLPTNNARDTYARPILEVFNIQKPSWDFRAEPSTLLLQTQLPIKSLSVALFTNMQRPTPLHDSTWWAERTQEFDFSSEDKLDADKYNRLLWLGTMGDVPYPEER